MVGKVRGSFDAETDPTMTFASTCVERDRIAWTITGGLTWNG